MSQNFQRDRERGDDWARDVPWERGRHAYEDFGWERGQSVLPEFRDPDIHVQPYERERVNRWRYLDWNREYNYGEEISGPYAGVGPSDYQRPDERIFEDVCERLTYHGRIDASKIRVNVKNGEVTLDGSVPDRQTRRAAEMVVDRVFGVKDVHNNLHAVQRDYNRARQTRRGRESGMPGGGKGRTDEVGGSGVYPASGPMPPRNAETQGQASWGQGERGAAGYEDSGSSEIHNPKRKDE